MACDNCRSKPFDLPPPEYNGVLICDECKKHYIRYSLCAVGIFVEFFIPVDEGH